MPGFAKVEASADFSALEREVLQFWDANGIFEKRRALNAGKPKWKFLDGPITANNPMGVHHAWGRTYKDAFSRYFAMAGHDLRYRNGFDCQGLWVEVEVEKELKLRSKRDIESLVPGDVEASIDKFVQACKDRVNTFRDILEAGGVPCTIRVQRGVDIDAACGQLAGRHQSQAPAKPSVSPGPA